MPDSLAQSLRRLWTLDKFAYSLRVFLALGGAIALGWHLDRIALTIPLFLGIIASALAETDDNWEGRVRALLVTLVCFAVASLSVELLFPWPWLFAPGLALSAFVFIMLGAVGPRYATIASATLILSVYSMISIEQHGGTSENVWRQPLLLVGGAAWYGLISVIWCALFSRQPLKQSMAQLYRELGEYLIIKATLFEPLRGLDVEERRVALARQNGRVVTALNQAKEMIFRRLEGQRGSRKLNRYLRLYFIAQDIHERVSASHYPYSALAEAFFHHDVLFRCQRLLDQQGRACKRLARALLLRQPFDHDQSEQALEDLHASIVYLRAQRNPDWTPLLRSLQALARNLTTLENQLSSAQNPDAAVDEQDASLFDRSPRSITDAWERVRLQLTPGSPTFRHALRLPIALLAGYAVLHLVHPTQGYWILLTTLFVCRPNFGATRRFLRQRIQGTVLGLVVGWALISLFPDPLVQSLIAVIAGVVFFANRERHYIVATAAITTLVLASFNQVGDGFDLILPRLFDTLVGALIAGLAVFFILPDWQGRRLHKVASRALADSTAYLREIIHQYESGKQDDLAYRLARRNAHNADAALSTVLGNMLQEPGHYRKKDADEGFRFLVVSHTLLGYLSALGAHRGTLVASADDAELYAAARRLADDLDAIAARLQAREPIADPRDEQDALVAIFEREPAAARDDADDERRVVQTQLLHLSRQLVPLSEAAARLVARPVEADDETPAAEPA
ncbi:MULTISPECIES: YccS family putative transporter [unclassified Modicisalibacter]|uniref:YccS family putative transporter n=1 Tax=unclassified Modicisalibacter TaxID=2679913 RepID=UPI001CCE1565|nr:TIGR01666 family membrane protein [Modicisalibacter sp. R2A 31.J]MBZ9575500.1 TIGR01666 family membrane protein [Modicisalibacter sp. MOD 31.J]